MPLTVFDVKGIPGHRREPTDAALVAGGKHASGPHEAWMAADVFKGGVRCSSPGRTSSSGRWRWPKGSIPNCRISYFQTLT
jgi:hypothetical protein